MMSVNGLNERAIRLWRRRSAARRFGVPFTRAATFKLPRVIWLNGHRIPIEVPDEPCHRVAFVELLLDDCYRLRPLAKRAKIRSVIDIGANVGLFGLAARASFPAARIHAYEPDPTLRSVLAHQAKSAGVEFFLEAVGRDAGSVSLEAAPGGSVLTRTRPDPGGQISQIAFRQALERIGGEVNLVKMDCEGAEWEILADYESWRHVDFLTMEYHLTPYQGHGAIVSALMRIGFSVHWHRPATNFGLVFAERTET